MSDDALGSRDTAVGDRGDLALVDLTVRGERCAMKKIWGNVMAVERGPGGAL